MRSAWAIASSLRDALATPYTLGVSTGASLGAVIAIAFDWHMMAGVVGIWAGALAGAGLILLVVMGTATRGGQFVVEPAARRYRDQQRLRCSHSVGPWSDRHVSVLRHFAVADWRAECD